ncbi:hypothetical protein C7974DRAFT_23862 [Boeremia exigua]|uniref:uncharacterized protein n=1 Tax=Boeremia exigua TaxID=749465 RepID=UPI001E8E5936|nr:uncharacterized protein C7974DRAFT_23862 [Boeremia exigua]KAH6644592.1 hypothetical protein C7974DRAFT_23862 [Boeremia exigua]
MVHGTDEVARAGEQSQRLTVAFLALAWFFILLRVWTRTWIIANFGWDDASMVLAGMIFTLFSGSQLYLDGNGGGTHITSLEKLQDLTKWVVVSESTYLVAMMTVKISIGIFFMRIVVASWHLMLIYVTIGVNVVSSVASFFYVVFRCGPNVDRYVLQQLKNQCTPRVLDRFMAYQSAVFSTLTDLVFVLLPVVVLWNANMDRKSKISAGFILCLAASACICSIIRFQYVDGLTQIDDFFWNATNIAIWSTIECGASIIAGCLATLRPFLRRIFATADTITKSIRSSTSRSNGSSKRTNESTSTNTHFGSNQSRNEGSITDKPTFAEFITEPGEAIELSSDAGGERESQDQILRQQEQSASEFPCPINIVENPAEPTCTAPMHSKHRSWSSRHMAGSYRGT